MQFNHYTNYLSSILLLLTIGCGHIAPKPKSTESICDIRIDLSNREFDTWGDIDIKIICEVDEIFVLIKPIWGMRVKRVDEQRSDLERDFSSYSECFELFPLRLPNDLGGRSWDHVARKYKGKGLLWEYWVDPGEYYIELIYCMERTDNFNDLCICWSQPFTILKEYSYVRINEDAD